VIGFGIDLGGFSKETKTVIVGMERHGAAAKAAVLTGSPFSEKLSGEFSARLIREAAALREMLKLGKVAVDVPIDLQGLPKFDALEAWHLTHRPVDRTMNGLAPLASWLGACVARFGAITTTESRVSLGTQLFEAYPAASLNKIFGELGLRCIKDYKKPKKEHKELARLARLQLCKELKISASDQALEHDEIDAIICAITAVAADGELVSLDEYGLPPGDKLPSGYRVLKRNPFDEIRVTRRPFAEMLKAYERQ
jgi:predicted nuclease with RNAse H fold